MAAKLKDAFAKSRFWVQLTGSFREFDDEYLLASKGYHLLTFREQVPELLTKPYDSFVLKTYRKNVVENKLWPEEPQRGWLLPSNWYSRINDIVRTLVPVKYLDGVEFLIDRIKTVSANNDAKSQDFLEARQEGYYAAHVYVHQSFEIPRPTWDTEHVDVSIEIQITTQLHEVIRRLLHTYYDDARGKPVGDIKWQWDYRSDEFAANYLGHILHYVEGMIMEIRDRQIAKERMP